MYSFMHFEKQTKEYTERVWGVSTDFYANSYPAYALFSRLSEIKRNNIENEFLKLVCFYLFPICTSHWTGVRTRLVTADVKMTQPCNRLTVVLCVQIHNINRVIPACMRHTVGLLSTVHLYFVSLLCVRVGIFSMPLSNIIYTSFINHRIFLLFPLLSMILWDRKFANGSFTCVRLFAVDSVRAFGFISTFL